MNVARQGHTATLLNNGNVLVVGGFNAEGVLASAELFDPATKSWTMAKPMQTPRTRHTATLLLDGSVLIVGGITQKAHPAPMTASVERFNPNSGNWSSAKAMSIVRAFHVAARLPDGSVLVASGGRSGDPASQRTAERYNPISDAWTQVGKTRIPHNRGTATLLKDGTVLVAGGAESGLQYYNPTINGVNYSERFDPKVNGWIELAVMHELPFAHTATLLNDNTVLVAGGRSPQTYKTAVRYLPSFQRGGQDYANVWHYMASLDHRRSNHQATLLPGGDVLVTGGFYDCIDRTHPPGTCADSLSSVELYHPDPNSTARGTWSNKESMFEARGDHTATLLNDGTVLVAGGYKWSANRPLESAEIYHPAGRPR